ncbi:hypothetical protein [Streptomyces sp. AM8-1-1]|uniref:hypothetical protein n=1 Tax=Streptomyces sp. AM8-1-1 TaxID=3075825 RepID=UPI0028C4CF9D|nr:hypothetical protein [Streptomyces sp. AM8-1-1]WNO74125.1 hypothetical protein RPQ07_21980 [Streptomyces sp. AM8-1-1]
MWSYSVTHRTLLLRSDVGINLASLPRIEVSAVNVQVVFLRSVMRGLEIRKVSDSGEVAFLAEKFGIKKHLDHMFALNSESGDGLIVAGEPSWAVADCAVDAPSLFSRVGEVDRYPDGVMGRVASEV